MGLQEIRNIKATGGILKPKKVYHIPKKSKKRIEKEKLQYGSDEALDAWFEDRRKDLVGVCQCGCAHKSQKKDDTYYRHCICHVFPKRIFKSVQCHPLNYVERAFWGGCHTNLDERGMDRWPGMADWDDIKMKFEILVPYLTKEEKATKFFTKLEELVRQN
jgi:hypothetical protein